MKNIDIDYKILAKHFKKHNSNMLLLKKKYKENTSKLWAVYVKAYNFDMIVDMKISFDEKEMLKK